MIGIALAVGVIFFKPDLPYALDTKAGAFLFLVASVALVWLIYLARLWLHDRTGTRLRRTIPAALTAAA